MRRWSLLASLLTAFFVGQADALEKVSVLHSSVSGSQAVLFVTRDARIFEKHGLDVEIRFVAGGPIVIQSLLAGDVHLAVAAGPAAVAAKLRGADVAIIMGLVHTMEHTIFAQPGIKRPEELRGKKVAVARYGSLDDSAARFALQKWGIPEKEVAFLQFGEQGNRLTALKAGGVDATLIQPPLTAVARKAGLTELAALADLEIDYLGTSVITTRALIKGREELIRRFVRAFVEGIHFYKTNKAASLVSIARFMRLEDPEALEETYRQYALKFTPRAPYPTAKGIQTILDDLGKKDPKARAANPSDFVESRFVRELEESGAIKALYGQ
jgi:ABC-type nitrate/sulfonate/bicarbonate transport system substrate-binding protein